MVVLRAGATDISQCADSQHVSGNQLEFLTPNDWILLSAKAQRRTFRLGEEIVREGSLRGSVYIIRRGQASVELAATSSREVVAWLGPDDICGDMAFLAKGNATAAVVAKDEIVEADEFEADVLLEILESFPGLASRFYQSLALVLARRLRDTSRALAREMTSRDRGASQ
jgi:extracellular factor (EF) 3-hydroxypalmitic acid methyl ester biosynthesis protein